jgi:hypothetical protein
LGFEAQPKLQGVISLTTGGNPNKSIEKTLNLLIKLRELYLREYQEHNDEMSWKFKLEDLFDAYVHQNSLEYAASYMAEYSSGNLDTHKDHKYLLETAISNCKENRSDAMEAINKGGGYMPQSIEETLRLLTEFYELYLLEYKKQTEK